MNKELMPCPFCGSAPLVNIIQPHKHSWAEMPDHPGSCVIECGCGAGLIDDTQELVSNRWNARAESSSEPAQLEKAPEPEWVHLEFTGKETIATSLYTSPPEVAELRKQVQALQAQLKKEFANGILTAAAIFQSINDQPSMAASILRETCLNFYDCSELDDFDKEHLRKINKETDMHLTGLNKS